MKIEIKTADGVADAHLVQPTGNGPWPAVLFFMDGIGLRPELVAMAERFAAHGYVVLLPNMFYRTGPFAPFNAKTVFDDPPERERVMALVRSVTFEAAMRDTSAFLDFLVAQPQVSSKKVGTVGYCLGGGLALTAAGTFPQRVAAAASIHGARLATSQPDSPHLLAPKMEAELYVGIAEIDRSFTPEDRVRLTAALEAAGLRVQVEVYPRVAHGFAVGDTAVYDREAAERHWERVLALFKRAL